MKAAFPIDAHRTAIAIAYSNSSLIADLVLPRIPVGKQEFTYMKYAMEESFTLPDTKVGRRSAPKEVSFSASEKTDSTEDYALDDPLPNRDIENAPEGHDPLDQSTEGLTDLILLDREQRTAGAVFDASSYATSNKETLSGADQFNDAGSDPIATIMDALDSMIMRGNIMVIGRPAFSALARNPAIVKAAHGNSGDSGIANRRAIAELFELQEILVGESFVNTAKRGQTPSISRVWGKHISLIHQNRAANNRQGATFGYTAQFGDRISGGEFDSSIGMRGGVRNRVGESVKEVICAGDLGYFIQDAVA
jgi:hypothetical protein